ncbi:MAG TPA: DnaJ C-terminal domain-containing protein, partial [Schlesneria sp.]
VIRLSGQGAPGTKNGPAGDLYLTIEIKPHRYFRREGANLLLEVPITPSEAALGAKVEVPTLNEGNVVMTIPAGTSSGAKLRLRGKGIQDPQTNQPGDQFVVIKIAVPKGLSDADKKLYEQLAASETSPRSSLW